MTRLFILLVVMTLGVCRAEVPKLFCEQAFNCATLADAVNHFTGLGKDSAVKELNQLALMEADEKEKNRGFNTRGFSIKERNGWVCRILFEPKPDEAKSVSSGAKKAVTKRHPFLRAPKFGRLDVPEKFMQI